MTDFPEILFDIDDVPAQDSLSRLADLTGKSTGTIIKNRAPTLARYLAEATMPVAGLTQEGGDPDGISNIARDLGRAAVKGDIARIYASPSVVFDKLKKAAGPKVARAFYAALKKGDFATARIICQTAGQAAIGRLDIITWDGGALHRRNRNKRGRVNRGRKPVLVNDPAALKKYVKEKQSLVGFAKSGWINAALSIKPGGRIPAWIRNNKGPGVGRDETKDPTHPRIFLTNAVNYIDSILLPRYRNRAITSFSESLQKEIDIVLAKLAARETALANGAATS